MRSSSRLIVRPVHLHLLGRRLAFPAKLVLGVFIDGSPQIVCTPAATLAGVLVKIRLGRWFEDGDEWGMAEMHKSIIADIEAMVGGAPS